ncbi:hypothetical protein FJT64_014932 [Amphibalanus amphitrite]|uniref:Uncharacterized protein n=1 Tax=Amphibalanus amphitrite TaxID=1232801 RepID=A0A6A4XEX0_AMPAM|nr:hypothetical protein FJT64_014932 [Amphibalanus amphitrite]
MASPRPTLPPTPTQDELAQSSARPTTPPTPPMTSDDDGDSEAGSETAYELSPTQPVWDLSQRVGEVVRCASPWSDESEDWGTEAEEEEFRVFLLSLFEEEETTLTTSPTPLVIDTD